jgi:hypothetical protein
MGLFIKKKNEKLPSGYPEGLGMVFPVQLFQEG